jgi:hypothetical protein
VPRVPTAAVAAGSLILGFGVAVASGSRPLGGVVLALGGLWCIRRWLLDHGPRTAAGLAIVGLVAFAASHVLALAIGPWPAVVVVSVLAAAVIWRRADARPSPAREARAVSPGAAGASEPAR